MKITVRITSSYGNERIFPVDDTAHLFAAIAGTLTLTRQTLDHIRKLGYEIVVQPATL